MKVSKAISGSSGLKMVHSVVGGTESSNQSRAQAQMIEDLLDMSRISSGRVRPDVRRLVLADAVSLSRTFGSTVGGGQRPVPIRYIRSKGLQLFVPLNTTTTGKANC